MEMDSGLFGSHANPPEITYSHDALPCCMGTIKNSRTWALHPKPRCIPFKGDLAADFREPGIVGCRVWGGFRVLGLGRF